MRAHRVLVHRPGAVLDYVFSAFLRSRQRWQSSGDYSLHHLRICAERRWTFARVEHAETPGSSRADVKKPSSLSEAVLGDGDGGRDLLSLSGDGIGNHAVFRVYDIHNLQRSREID